MDASGARALVLSRLYLSLPSARLDAPTRAFAEASLGHSPLPTDRFLCLVGTQGDLEGWRRIDASVRHRAIPLNRATLGRAPMLARLFEEIDVDLDSVLHAEAGLFLETIRRTFGIFHVAEAAGSPFIPAQDEFVRAHGVRSVVGCGAMLPDGAVSTWIGFSREPLSRPPHALVTLLPSFWERAQKLYRRGAIFEG